MYLNIKIIIITLFFCINVAYGQNNIYFLRGDLSQDIQNPTKSEIYLLNEDSSKLFLQKQVFNYKYAVNYAIIDRNNKNVMICAKNIQIGEWHLKYFSFNSLNTIQDISFGKKENVHYLDWPIVYNKNNETYFQHNLSILEQDIDVKNPNQFLFNISLNQNKLVTPDYKNYVLAKIYGNSPCATEKAQFIQCTPNFRYKNPNKRVQRGNVKIYYDSPILDDTSKMIEFKCNFSDSVEVCYRPNVYLNTNELQLISVDTVPYFKNGSNIIFENNYRKFWVYNKKKQQGI
jgi:hypothetical protein